MRGLEMITPKQLSLSIAAVISAVLLLGQPAHALTAIAQPYLLSSWERVDAVEPIGDGRWHDSAEDSGRMTGPGGDTATTGPGGDTATIELGGGTRRFPTGGGSQDFPISRGDPTSRA